MVWPVEPLRTTVPPLALNVPSFVQLCATLMAPPDGPVTLLKVSMKMSKNELTDVPPMAWVPEPLKCTAPPLALNAPSFVQLCATLIVPPDGPVTLLKVSMKMSKNELTVAPPMAWAPEPLKRTAPLLWLNVPLLVQSLATFMLALCPISAAGDRHIGKRGRAAA